MTLLLVESALRIFHFPLKLVSDVGRRVPAGKLYVPSDCFSLHHLLFFNVLFLPRFLERFSHSQDIVRTLSLLLESNASLLHLQPLMPIQKV